MGNANAYMRNERERVHVDVMEHFRVSGYRMAAQIASGDADYESDDFSDEEGEADAPLAKSLRHDVSVATQEAMHRLALALRRLLSMNYPHAHFLPSDPNVDHAGVLFKVVGVDACADALHDILRDAANKDPRREWCLLLGHIQLQRGLVTLLDRRRNVPRTVSAYVVHFNYSPLITELVYLTPRSTWRVGLYVSALAVGCVLLFKGSFVLFDVLSQLLAILAPTLSLIARLLPLPDGDWLGHLHGHRDFLVYQHHQASSSPFDIFMSASLFPLLPIATLSIVFLVIICLKCVAPCINTCKHPQRSFLSLFLCFSLSLSPLLTLFISLLVTILLPSPPPPLFRLLCCFPILCCNSRSSGNEGRSGDNNNSRNSSTVVAIERLQRQVASPDDDDDGEDRATMNGMKHGGWHMNTVWSTRRRRDSR